MSQAGLNNGRAYVSNEDFLKKAITIYINTRFYLTVNKENDVAIDEAEPFKRLLDGNVYCIFLFYKALFCYNEGGKNSEFI